MLCLFYQDYYHQRLDRLFPSMLVDFSTSYTVSIEVDKRDCDKLVVSSQSSTVHYVQYTPHQTETQKPLLNRNHHQLTIANEQQSPTQYLSSIHPIYQNSQPTRRRTKKLVAQLIGIDLSLSSLKTLNLQSVVEVIAGADAGEVVSYRSLIRLSCLQCCIV